MALASTIQLHIPGKQKEEQKQLLIHMPCSLSTTKCWNKVQHQFRHANAKHRPDNLSYGKHVCCLKHFTEKTPTLFRVAAHTPISAGLGSPSLGTSDRIRHWDGTGSHSPFRWDTTLQPEHLTAMCPAGIHVPRAHTHILPSETEIISCGRFQKGFLLFWEHRRVAKA